LWKRIFNVNYLDNVKLQKEKEKEKAKAKRNFLEIFPEDWKSVL
jgi:hypothetical protein